MPDILIRGFPAADLRLLDEQAARLGLSRSAFLRRQLQSDARRSSSSVAASDLQRLAQLLPDLADTDVMRDAWS